MSIRFLLAIFVGITIIGAILALAVWQEGGIPDAGDQVKKFASRQELADYLKTRETQYRGYYGPEVLPMMDRAMPAAGEAMQKSGIPFSWERAADYSTTNIQVVGVDEADFVKNDGKYIYILSEKSLVIVEAYPAETARTLSTTDLQGQPVEMFLYGERLVVFATGSEEIYTRVEKSIAPVPYWRPLTHAYVYSLADRSAPRLLHDITISGNYEDSRRIGNQVYLITLEPVRWFQDDPVVPQVQDGRDRTFEPDLYYFDIPEAYYTYHTISSFAIDGDGSVEAESFLLGQATTLYASIDHLYMAYQKSPLYRWMEDTSRQAVPEREMITMDRTVIHRFSIDNGKIAYDATGEVGGHLLNQFSLDEFGNHLRVATTVEGWGAKGSYLFNNVYVLDEHMDVTGTLEFIAPEERIYSTRFLGDRLYMVTFKRIDPFFVIDLSDPKTPAILGKLKLPGYSDYLHPYDQDTIIGIGKETEENAWGGASIAGLKLALFDVSDVNTPALIDKVEIGEAGTDSPVLTDHKAFLFDRGKDLLVIPVREVQKVSIPGKPYESYTQKIWQGAYVFGVSPEKGFTIRGTVTHSADEAPYYYFDSPNTVRRSLYMDDVLYSISSRELIASDLTNLKRTIKELPLPYAGGEYPYPLLK